MEFGHGGRVGLLPREAGGTGPGAVAEPGCADRLHLWPAARTAGRGAAGPPR
ncbi:hypothetical protein AB0D97_30895 [Streptomyces roseus]|uniref:hypothetical protein n=1 Tax=Streptomyces roseus TaxID=66430 RepID=UPI0033F06852